MPDIKPFTIQNFHITGLKQHQTHDGVAFVCVLREQGKKVASAEQDGRGGDTFLFFDDRVTEARFSAAAQAFNAQQAEPYLNEVNNALLEHLIAGYELDRLSKKKTVFRSAETDELGIHKEWAFTPPLRPEQYSEVVRRHPDCTHVWVTGQGWCSVTS